MSFQRINVQQSESWTNQYKTIASAIFEADKNISEISMSPARRYSRIHDVQDDEVLDHVWQTRALEKRRGLKINFRENALIGLIINISRENALSYSLNAQQLSYKNHKWHSKKCVIQLTGFSLEKTQHTALKINMELDNTDMSAHEIMKKMRAMNPDKYNLDATRSDENIQKWINNLFVHVKCNDITRQYIHDYLKVMKSRAIFTVEKQNVNITIVSDEQFLPPLFATFPTEEIS